MGFGSSDCIWDLDQFNKLNNNKEALLAFSLNSGIKSSNSSLDKEPSFSKSIKPLIEESESFKSWDTIEKSLSFTLLTFSKCFVCSWKASFCSSILMFFSSSSCIYFMLVFRFKYISIKKVETITKAANNA